MVQIHILIPVFKRLTHTIQFVDSCNQHISSEKQYVIIDDSPDKEHLYYYNGKDPNIKVICGTGDLWWGGSVNLGMEYLLQSSISESDAVIIANNDTIINSSTWESIRPYLNNNPESLYTSRVVNTNNKEINSGALLKSWIPLRANYIIAPTSDLTEIDLVTGRFLCSSWATFKKIGFISKNLPHYGGDWDYSLKAKSKGIKTYIVKNSITTVDESTTGIRYEHGITAKAFYEALFKDIKSPQNVKYIYRFYRNHNGPFMASIGTFSNTLKTIAKYLIGKF